MNEWIASLTALQRFFALCAALGGVLFVLRTALMLLGGDDAAGEGGDSDASFQFLSLQGLTAFFTMFGLVALALSRQNQVSDPLAVGGGVLAGLGSVWLLGRLFVGMKRLQSDGTLKIENAIGEAGEVYLNIPADGSGQIRITVQGRLRILDAVSAGKVPLKTGTRVRVSKVIDSSTLEVTPD